MPAVASHFSEIFSPTCTFGLFSFFSLGGTATKRETRQCETHLCQRHTCDASPPRIHLKRVCCPHCRTTVSLLPAFTGGHKRWLARGAQHTAPSSLSSTWPDLMALQLPIHCPAAPYASLLSPPGLSRCRCRSSSSSETVFPRILPLLTTITDTSVITATAKHAAHPTEPSPGKAAKTDSHSA